MVRKTKEEALETRNKLLDAAVRVFHARGVSRTSLAEIAESAGMTRGAIYWHFKNKTDLFNAMFDRIRLPLDAMLTEAMGDENTDPLGSLRASLVFLFRETARDPHYRMVFDILFHKCEFVEELGALLVRDRELKAQALERFERVFQRAEHHGQLPQGINHRVAAVIYHGYVCGILQDWVFAPESFDLEANAELITDAVFDMLATSPALRRCVPSADTRSRRAGSL